MCGFVVKFDTQLNFEYKMRQTFMFYKIKCLWNLGLTFLTLGRVTLRV